MDSLSTSPTNGDHAIMTPTSAASTPAKRHLSTDDGPPPSKKNKANVVEEPHVYSDAVRKKLAATSRTGQACDRCKERKMKCDIDPVACQPCRQKKLRCYTTDRVTGESRERGASNRAENELQLLRDQNAAYRKKYGPLQPGDMPGYASSDVVKNASYSITETVQGGSLPSSVYIGWPAPDRAMPLQHGPVNGTEIDTLSGIIDIADFDCEIMKEYSASQLNVFNVSRTSITNTTTGYQTITDPRLPSKDEALQNATTYLVILNQFAPILHRPSFIDIVHRIYDKPQQATLAERVQLVVVLAIVSFQAAVRNHSEAAEKFEQSHYWLHYGLTWYRELIRERSLASMQALALILLHLRNMPKPGYSWSFAHNIVMKAIELDYHRDPDRIVLPPSENNPLGKEMRKRVFHAIFGICVTTGCRVSKPAPWQFQHIDVPLPRPVRDSELSERHIEQPTGKCDFWPSLQLAKLLPLLMEAYNHVTVVRHPEAEYIKIVDALHTKIDAWRKDWDKSIENDENHVNMKVATLLMESWTAEYILNLYHPSLCPSRSPEIMDKHLDICHKQAQRLLKSFHTLSQRYKGVDFTWHSTAAYAVGFGVTLYIYTRRKGRTSYEQFEVMQNELKGWMSLMAYADLVMKTGNHLQHIFQPRVNKLEAEYRQLLPRNSQDSNIAQSGSNLNVNVAASKVQGISDVGAGQTPYNILPNGGFPSGGQVQNSNRIFSPPQTSHSQPWPQVQYTPSAPPTTFPNYTQAPNQAPSRYNTVPTTLAPLLAESAGGFMSYPATSTVPNDMMMYIPTHYTEPSASSNVWPMITLPPQEQNFNPNKA